MKILLTIAINLISSEDNDEERVVHSKSNNKEIKNDKKRKQVKLFKNFLNHFFKDIKIDWKHQ